MLKGSLIVLQRKISLNDQKERRTTKVRLSLAICSQQPNRQRLRSENLEVLYLSDTLHHSMSDASNWSHSFVKILSNHGLSGISFSV